MIADNTVIFRLLIVIFLQSFEKKNGGSLFHTVRYDFKPVSVDQERCGVLEVRRSQIAKIVACCESAYMVSKIGA
jgi:hypothetical protein